MKLFVSIATALFMGCYIAVAQTPSGNISTGNEAQPEEAKSASCLSSKDMAKVLKKETGIYGFMQRKAPSYITEGYTAADGTHVDGRPVKLLWNMPYGFAQLVMIPICLILIYFALVKGFDPLVLLPIAIGSLFANIPFAGISTPTMMVEGKLISGGFIYHLTSFGIDSGVFPVLIFMGVGALTDFGPLIANPKTFLLGVAAQLGIFASLIGALMLTNHIPSLGFELKDAAAIGIIGVADGTTAIWLANKLSPDKLGAIAVAAYLYMALVSMIQPPIMKLFTNEEERKIKMMPLRNVRKVEKVIFPIVVILLCAVFIPVAMPLIGAFMFGNIARESGVAERLSDTMQNSLVNIVIVCLGLAVGAKLSVEHFLTAETIGILFVGIIAFSIGTASGIVMAKIMNMFSDNKINPLIGSAGVSALMAPRVSNKMGLESDPENHLLMHAMGPNVSGVIGSIIIAGVLYSLLG